MSFWKKLFPPDMCGTCGEQINNSLFRFGGHSSVWHEVFCEDKVLGYDLYNERFAESTKVYYWNIYQKGMKP